MLVRLLIILVMLASIGFCAVAQMRLLIYVQKHPLPESKYTLLFKYIGIGHTSILYIAVIILHAVFLSWITFYYL